MAKVSAHGRIVGTIEYTTHAKRYMSDGVILKNVGFGWKIYGKVKPESTPEAVYARQYEKQREHLETHPALGAYRKALHAMAGLNKRWKLHATIQLMPEDYDGVWSECCDGYGDNVHADVDEIGELCRLYNAALPKDGYSAR